MSNYTKTTDFEAKDSLPSGDSGKIIKGAEFETEFDAISTAIATKANAAGATLTGTTSFETLSDGTISVTAFVDEDNMASDSATLVPTQQSVKAYVDSVTTELQAQDLDFQADSGGALNIDLDTETMTFTGGTGIDTTGSGNTVTFDIDSTVTTLTGTQTLTNKTLTAPVISGNLTTDGTIDGRDVATDGTKLDGIEAGATADQTAAEIRTLVESATDSNVFTDADHTKLDGIEASATADQTDAEIRAAVEAATDSNVFTDADHTKLDGIEALADVTDTTNVTAAGALMDSELTNLTAVKSLDQGVATTDTPTFAGLTTTADVSFGDNDKAIFGAGSDLQIYHSSSQSYIEDAGSGNLNFKSNGNNFNFLDGSDNVVMQIDMDSETTLYHNTNAKLATTSTGIDVTGAVVADGLTVDAAQSNFNDSAGSVIAFQKSASAKAWISNRSYSFHNGNGLAINTTDANPIIFGTNNAERLRIDSSGNVGIGTTNPDRAIKIEKDNAYVWIADAEGGNVGFIGGSGSNDGLLRLYEGAGHTAKVEIHSDADSYFNGGNVGIGTSSPANKLHVMGDSSTRNTIVSNVTLDGGTTVANPYEGFGFGVDFIGRDYGNAVRNYAGIYSLMEHKSSSSGGGDAGFKTGLSFYTNSGGASNTNPSEKMRIDSDGNVGIGTSSPSYPLTVHDTGDGIKFEVSDTVDANYRIQVSGSDIVTGPSTSSAYTFQTGNTERMRITNTGDVEVKSGGKLQANRADNARNIQLFNDSDFGTIQTSNDPIKIASQAYTRFDVGGAERLRIDASGNLLVSGTEANPAQNNTTDAISLHNAGLLRASTTNAAAPLDLNVKSRDGDIATFRKDGTLVGSIGSVSGYLYVGGTAGDDAFLSFGVNGVRPSTSAGAARDAAIDLGGSTNRFKDLHLSGGVYLGGTGSANHLDDYEEGTWTPTFLGSSTDPTVTYGTRHATYTKVGRLVTLFFDMTISSYSGGSGTVKVGGLPVAQSGNARGVGLTVGSTGVTHTQALSAQAIGSALFINESGIGDLPVSDVSTSGWRIIAECSYTAA